MPVKEQLEILTTEQPGRWMEALEEIGSYDFYHLPQYHRLAELRGEGQAVMPVYRQGKHIAAFPMLLREIQMPFVPQGLRDATSVYGYAGPLASGELSDEVRDGFHRSLQDYFSRNGIICAYSRLNPLTTPIAVLEGLGSTVEIGVTVSIDLTIPPDEQVSRYRKHFVQDVRRLKKQGCTCEEVGPEYLDDFIRIYHETMRRVNAEEVYFYDRSYFEYLINEMPGVIRLFVCRIGGEVVCASITSLCCRIVEGLYAGTPDEYTSLSPSKLMNDFRREWGNSVGAYVVHLGGGGGAKRDSLYDFKMGFGGREHIYCTWRYVSDQRVYDDLCREVFDQVGMEPDPLYFPRYRHPDLTLGNGG